MKRVSFGVALVVLAAHVAYADSYYLSPDVPMDDPHGSSPVMTPWDLVRHDPSAYSVVAELPPGTAVDALYRRENGSWLLSLESSAELPSSGGVLYHPADVIAWDGTTYSLVFDAEGAALPEGANVDALFVAGGDGGDLVMSFDAPVRIGADVYDPSDLVRFADGSFSLEFDASGATPPIPAEANVVGADERDGLIIVTFDAPVQLGGDEYAPGQLAGVDRATLQISSYLDDASWPVDRSASGLSFLPAPGTIGASLRVTRSASQPGDLTLEWSPSCSTGADDYGIYEGALGDFTSHLPITCSDSSSDGREDVTPSAGNRYYLVVPLNANDEGSAGWDSAGHERMWDPTTSCRSSRELGACR